MNASGRIYKMIDIWRTLPFLVNPASLRSKYVFFFLYIVEYESIQHFQYIVSCALARLGFRNNAEIGISKRAYFVGIRSVVRIRFRSDPVIFGPQDPDPDAYPICNNGYILSFIYF